MNDKPVPPPAIVPTRRSLPIALLRTRESVMQHFRPHLAALGLTEQQWRVMRVLGEEGAIEAGSLAERACVLPPSLSRIIKTLASDGLVRTGADHNDGRRTIVSLTAAGRKRLTTAAPNSARVYDAIEKAYGKDKLAALLDMLNDLHTVMQDVAP